jgi:hypothetical protein
MIIKIWHIKSRVIQFCVLREIFSLNCMEKGQENQFPKEKEVPKELQ